MEKELESKAFLVTQEVVIDLPNIEDGEDKSSPFKNCMRKNYKHIRKWAKRTSTNCFRIYDREIHHYPLAIDYYAGKYCVHYFSPRGGASEEPLDAFVEDVENVLYSLFKCDKEDIFWRSRIKRKKHQQYEKADTTKDYFYVYEYGVKFKVNLVDYLDTGLFLDHRETRQLVAKESKGKSVLNLFAYTCSFTVHSAVHGAQFTKSVDMSNTYTQWGMDNYDLNSIDHKNHQIVRDDCLKFLEHEAVFYDIIVIDPPTVSRSKKMTQMFDVQIDYHYLIDQSSKLLKEGGVIYFSTNSRRFDFEEDLFPELYIRDISKKTIPLDFHDPKIHRCWKISKKN